MEKREPSYTVGGDVNWCRLYGEQYGGFFKKVKIELIYDPAVPLLGIYLEKNSNLKRYMEPNVHCSTIYNNQDMEAA